MSPAKSSLADIADERFKPEMFPLVSRQLVRPGEPAVTVSPGTVKWLLSGVGPGMSLAGQK